MTIIYLADTLNHRVCKIDAKTGRVQHGRRQRRKRLYRRRRSGGESQIQRHLLREPRSGGERLYLADLDNRRIRMVDLGRES